MLSIRSISKKLVLTLAAVSSIGLTGCNDVQKALSIIYFPVALFAVAEISNNSNDNPPPRCTIREETVCTSTRDRYGYESGRECHVVNERYCSRRMSLANSTAVNPAQTTAQFSAEGLAGKYGWDVATSNEIYNYFSQLKNLAQAQNTEALNLQLQELAISTEDYFNFKMGIVSDDLATKFATKFNINTSAAQAFLRDLIKYTKANLPSDSQSSEPTAI